jgi:hypothetical protein
MPPSKTARAAATPLRTWPSSIRCTCRMCPPATTWYGGDVRDTLFNCVTRRKGSPAVLAELHLPPYPQAVCCHLEVSRVNWVYWSVQGIVNKVHRCVLSPVLSTS